MSVRRIERKKERILKCTIADVEIPLACRLSRSLAEHGWKSWVDPPRDYNVPTLHAKKVKKRTEERFV